MTERITRGFLRMLEALPLPVLSALCEAAMLALWAVDRKHRRIARINLRIAFPEMEEEEANRIIRKCYLRIGTSAAEFVHLPKMDAAYIREHVRIEGAEHVRRSMRERNQPTMVMTGHFGNWELQSHAYARVVEPLAFIVRPLKNGILDRISEIVRKKTEESV